MLSIWFIAEPSMMTESGTALSSPPSVAVPPVRGMTLTPFSSANRRISATIAVLRAMTTAAGTGMVCTLKMFCSLRKLSTLLSMRTCSSVITSPGPAMRCRPSTMASLLSCMMAILCVSRVWRRRQWKMGKDLSRIPSVASRMVW